MTARKSRENVTVSFNGTDITAYCRKADLDAAISQIDVTNLASTATETIASDPTWKINLEGHWDNALDAVIAPEAVTPGTKRTAIMTLEGTSATITYTWTSNAEIENYKITSTVGEFIGWSGTLSLSGAPGRT
jgi:hypothetical protein